MKFGDLFTNSAPKSPPETEVRIVRIDGSPDFKRTRNSLVQIGVEGHGQREPDTASKCKTHISALSAVSAPCQLVPMDAGWIEGARYRDAGVFEVANRLPLFVADPEGDTIRLHGTLLTYNAIGRAG